MDQSGGHVAGNLQRLAAITMILLIDNYDSFVHNLARYLRQLGQETWVVRNDKISINEIVDAAPDAIVLSPGPCGPAQAGVSLQLVRELHSSIPILGICLGHQTIAAAFGADVCQASEPVHGRSSQMTHNAGGLFSGLPSPMRVARYHSLVVDNLPDCLVVDAQLEDGTPMAISHREFPVHGWQFHPESVLTEYGYELLAEFLRRTQLSVGPQVPSPPHPSQQVSRSDWFQTAIQFPVVKPVAPSEEGPR